MSHAYDEIDVRHEKIILSLRAEIKKLKAEISKLKPTAPRTPKPSHD